MLHTLDAEQGIRNLPNGGPLASRHQDLKTMVMVEMDMHPRHDVPLEIVLNVGEFPRQIRHMVIVDKRNRGHRLFVLVPLLPDQIVPDQVTDRFGAVGILAPLDQAIEIHEQVLIEGHAESDKLLHKLYECYELCKRGTPQ